MWGQMSDGSSFDSVFNTLLFDWLQFDYESDLSVCNEFKSYLIVG